MNYIKNACGDYTQLCAVFQAERTRDDCQTPQNDSEESQRYLNN